MDSDIWMDCSSQNFHQHRFLKPGTSDMALYIEVIAARSENPGPHSWIHTHALKINNKI